MICESTILLTGHLTFETVYPNDVVLSDTVNTSKLDSQDSRIRIRVRALNGQIH